MTVGKRIRRSREALGMSQVDFAEKIGVSKQTLYKYENDIITNVPSDKIELAAKLLQVSPGYLMGWEELNSSKDIISLNSSPNTRLLFKEYEKLNNKGQIKLIETARDMICNPLYNDDYEIELKAAHERTDLEITDEMIEADNAIMDDNNF